MKKPRSVGIVIDTGNRSLLIMKRHAHGKDYYTLPGGKIERGESPEHACIREVHEETGLEVTIKRKILEMENLGRLEHYFLIDTFKGKLELAGPEAIHQNADNSYDPQWVSIDRINEVNLLPVSIREVCRVSLQEKVHLLNQKL